MKKMLLMSLAVLMVVTFAGCPRPQGPDSSGDGRYVPPNILASSSSGKLVIQFNLSEAVAKVAEEAEEKGGGGGGEGYLDYPPLDPATTSVIAEMIRREVSWVRVSIYPFFGGASRQQDFQIDPIGTTELVLDGIDPGEYYVDLNCGVDHGGEKFYVFYGYVEAVISSGAATSCYIGLSQQGYEIMFKIKNVPVAVASAQLMYNGWIKESFSVGSDLWCKAWMPFYFQSDRLAITAMDGSQVSMDIELNYFDVLRAENYTPALNWPDPGQLVIYPEFNYPAPASLNVVVSDTDAKLSFSYGGQIPEKLFGYAPESVAICALYEYEVLIFPFSGPGPSITIPRPRWIQLVVRPSATTDWQSTNPEQWFCLVDGEVILPDIDLGWTMPGV